MRSFLAARLPDSVSVTLRARCSGSGSIRGAGPARRRTAPGFPGHVGRMRDRRPHPRWIDVPLTGLIHRGPAEPATVADRQIGPEHGAGEGSTRNARPGAAGGNGYGAALKDAGSSGAWRAVETRCRRHRHGGAPHRIPNRGCRRIADWPGSSFGGGGCEEWQTGLQSDGVRSSVPCGIPPGACDRSGPCPSQVPEPAGHSPRNHRVLTASSRTGRRQGSRAAAVPGAG